MILKGESGKQYTIGKKIGEGGQGAVWSVASDRYCVIKTLMSSESELPPGEKKTSGQGYERGRIVQDETRYDGFARKINALIALGILSNIQRIALPDEMLERPYCGFTMRLMDGLESISKQMKHSDDQMIPRFGTNSSLEKKLLVLRCLADILKNLHGQGLVYCDLSPANVFVSKNPNDHEVWLIDSDNLVYADRSKRCIGTPKYQAPEIYKQESPNSFYSDMYSFALIAFEYLTGARPFSDDSIAEEFCWDAKEFTDGDADLKDDAIEQGDVSYGYEFGETYESGIPLNFVSNNKMRRLFYRTFCEAGRKNAQIRPSAGEWYEALDEALHSVCFCPEAHAFLGKDCVWCRKLNLARSDMKIYILHAETQSAEEDSDWENTLPPSLKEYFCKEKYLYQWGADAQNLKIPAEMFTLNRGGGEINVTLVDKGIVFSEGDCRKYNFKLFIYKNSKLTVCYKYPTPAVGEKYTLLAACGDVEHGKQRTYTQIIIQRLK